MLEVTRHKIWGTVTTLNELFIQELESNSLCLIIHTSETEPRERAFALPRLPARSALSAEAHLASQSICSPARFDLSLNFVPH
jgi:hypothetical protein